MFTPTDHYLWDFWFAPRESGEPFDMFYLSAPRNLPDPEDRHLRARIRHAVSEDLVNWTPLGVAFEPGSIGGWDDLATWTGSVIRQNEQWWLFYSGVESLTRGRIQRIGAAISEDLQRWTRPTHAPLLEAGGPHYVTSENAVRGGADFRDPWVMRDEDD